MLDETEQPRRALQAQIHGNIQSDSLEHEKIRLQEEFGENNVWTTDALRQQFDVVAFLAPFIQVIRKSDGAHGIMEFQHQPRLYFNFKLA